MVLSWQSMYLENGYWSEKFIMYYIVNSMSFPMYILVLASAFIFSIYGIYEMRVKKPGHPMIWTMPFAMLTSVCLIAYRCATEFSLDINLQRILNIITIISIVFFVISVIVTFIIADKKNYTAKGKKAKYAKSTLISSLVVAVICIIFIIVVYTMRENNWL